MKYPKILASIATALCMAPAFQAQAQVGNYPTRPVKIIVANAPGGGSDQIARLVAQKLSESMKQSFIVDNKAGAGGSIGTREAAKAPPDGYTLAIGTSATHGSNPWMYEKIGYDALADFSPITVLASTDYALAVPADSEIKSVADLLRIAKAKEIQYGSSGAGSTGHVIAAMLASKTGIQLSHIPYKGAAPAMNDLMAGRFAFMFDNTNVLAPFHKAGKVRIIATTGQARSKALTGVPTMIEAGVPDFTMLGWWALFAPAKTPEDIIARMNAETVRILESPEVTNFLVTNGNSPMPMSPAQTRQFVAQQLTLFKNVVSAAKIKLD